MKTIILHEFLFEIMQFALCTVKFDFFFSESCEFCIKYTTFSFYFVSNVLSILFEIKISVTLQAVNKFPIKKLVELLEIRANTNSIQEALE